MSGQSDWKGIISRILVVLLTQPITPVKRVCGVYMDVGAGMVMMQGVRTHGFWMCRTVLSGKWMWKGTVGAVVMTSAPCSCSRR